ncbi:MAG: hypothetical protein COZ06_23390 [Armatimonadetes bacterium CG_4_10_14_3_um_filter_66_18]|nr:hypothetical protein [Armatimonadota bacterium]OIP12205.1 MAG: hypothetical protein AUJ96_00800 [Armatimonadetes bacterium CG2_30_66_41]PIU88905.1 MAG: hypothetical protein COS65_29740 [Armatimonadetes bacterium CG06_land_8_20_14_3_00_66_21]PIX38743.1 MAG: hypothetical protein COZ57_29835 [Armatimonadetes bacterium CG_4_8_14_3_um_filter_66_20]PIY43208.1 MAG: hypothetical protein COZ06_23390 [Armatimonadetes bacterium CG_4_10_14_3_um_filter_66_18]PIZ48666.1 MAG: hypothetical protein COY42_05
MQPWWRPGTNTKTDIRYDGLAMSYIKNRQVYDCPSTTLGYNSYATSRQLLESNGGCDGRLLAQIVKPSEHVLFADGAGTRGLCGANRPTNCQGRVGKHDTGQLARKSRFYRHNEGMNIAYVDGHVKWFKTPGSPDVSDSGGMGNGTQTDPQCARMFGNPSVNY